MNESRLIRKYDEAVIIVQYELSGSNLVSIVLSAHRVRATSAVLCSHFHSSLIPIALAKQSSTCHHVS